MVEDVNFTAEQLALIGATESTYVEACPGAGKTRCIIERFVRRDNADPRRGVALISFTNAVVDEARARCSERPELVRSPNFVGTIDSFINHFIVGPLLASEGGRLYSFRRNWQHVPGSLIRINGVPAQAQLDWFTFTADGNATLDLTRVPVDRVRMIANLESRQITRLEQAAGQQWRHIIGRGVLDAAASRLYLKKYLQDETTRAFLIELMSSRFYEVIVDEVQDCSAEDSALLQLLLDAGVRLILVGDPEQAIYSFRGSSASELSAVLNAVEQGARLDGNFRSSAAICTAVDSLRSSDATDRAIGTNKDVTHAVRLVRYNTPNDARKQIRAVLAECDFSADDLVVLAHASNKARTCAGAGSAPSTSGGNKLVRLANLVHDIQNEDTPARTRADALAGLEALLRELTPDHLQALTLEAYLECVGLGRRAYHEHCLRLAMSLPDPYAAAPSAFKATLVAKTESQELLGWEKRGLRKPDNDQWPPHPSGSADADKYSTIHGYKGLQSAAVAMIIPQRSAGAPAAEDGLSQWTEDYPGEARNVMYVGASRAEQLLIIATHSSVFDEVQQNLDRDGVSYTVHAG